MRCTAPRAMRNDIMKVHMILCLSQQTDNVSVFVLSISRLLIKTYLCLFLIYYHFSGIELVNSIRANQSRKK